MRNFCENTKCIFHNIKVENDDHVVRINKETKIKSHLNRIGIDGTNFNEIWLCDCCIGVLELVNNLVDFSKIKDGVVN